MKYVEKAKNQVGGKWNKMKKKTHTHTRPHNPSPLSPPLHPHTCRFCPQTRQETSKSLTRFSLYTSLFIKTHQPLSQDITTCLKITQQKQQTLSYSSTECATRTGEATQTWKEFKENSLLRVRRSCGAFAHQQWSRFDDQTHNSNDNKTGSKMMDVVAVTGHKDSGWEA